MRPDSVPGSPAAMANELGLRNVGFEVDNLQAVVDRFEAGVTTRLQLVFLRSHRGPTVSNCVAAGSR